jgi:hypothetical protein
MPPNANQPANRREFLRATARYGWVVGLGTALGWLATRNRRASSCSALSPCITCPAFNDCGLPPALESKATNVAAEEPQGPPLPP